VPCKVALGGGRLGWPRPTSGRAEPAPPRRDAREGEVALLGKCRKRAQGAGFIGGTSSARPRCRIVRMPRHIFAAPGSRGGSRVDIPKKVANYDDVSVKRCLSIAGVQRPLYRGILYDRV